MKKFIQRIEKASGLDHREIAEHIGVTPSAVSNYRNGVREPRPWVAKRLLKLARRHGLEMSFDDIYC